MASSPIKSLAQHAMLTRAATDADYAKQRGITSESAQSMLDAHKDAGEPKLPERTEAKPASAPRKAPTRPWWETR